MLPISHSRPLHDLHEVFAVQEKAQRVISGTMPTETGSELEEPPMEKSQGPIGCELQYVSFMTIQQGWPSLRVWSCWSFSSRRSMLDTKSS